jgi:hypothetical protein
LGKGKHGFVVYKERRRLRTGILGAASDLL